MKKALSSVFDVLHNTRPHTNASGSGHHRGIKFQIVLAAVGKGPDYFRKRRSWSLEAECFTLIL